MNAVVSAKCIGTCVLFAVMLGRLFRMEDTVLSHLAARVREWRAARRQPPLPPPPGAESPYDHVGT